jgi:hypothetical protein
VAPSPAYDRGPHLDTAFLVALFMRFHLGDLTLDVFDWRGE